MKYYILNEKQIRRIIEEELELECLSFYHRDELENPEEFLELLKEQIGASDLDVYEDEEIIIEQVIEERLKDYEGVDFNG